MKDEPIISEDDYKYLSEAKSIEDFNNRITDINNGLEYALNTESAKKILRDTHFLNKDGSINMALYKEVIAEIYENKDEDEKNYISEDDYLVHESFYQGAEEIYYHIKGGVMGKSVHLAKRVNRKMLKT
ncbi:hypothetical protein P6439_13910 [Staphylococcus arlettae]|nr:hypothetical protein [Staphylococcus arlettae]